MNVSKASISMKLAGQLVRIADIDESRRDQMYLLMDQYYENTDRPTFEADLAAKDWVIEVFDPSTNDLKGFSTQVLHQLDIGVRPIRVLFSGDTIVDRNWRGQQALFQVSGWFLRQLIDAYPHEDLYWFLTSKGYKTYRFLPLFFNEFYPRINVPMPDHVSAMIDRLALRIGGSRYDRKVKVLRSGENAHRLRSGVAEITESRMRDEHVRFFCAANPDHAKGDELCCIAPVSLKNFTRAAYRAMGTESPINLELV